MTGQEAGAPAVTAMTGALLTWDPGLRYQPRSTTASLANLGLMST